MPRILLVASPSVKSFLVENYYDFLMNDYDVYRRQRSCINNCLEKKINKGTYDSDKALKAFYNLAYMNKKTYLKQLDSSLWQLEGETIDNLETEMLKEVSERLREDFESNYL